MARRDDARGFFGMTDYYSSGTVVHANPQKVETCLIEAARRDHLRGIILLAEFDLNLRLQLMTVLPTKARG